MKLFKNIKLRGRKKTRMGPIKIVVPSQDRISSINHLSSAVEKLAEALTSTSNTFIITDCHIVGDGKNPVIELGDDSANKTETHIIGKGIKEDEDSET